MVKSRDLFLKDKMRFELMQQLCICLFPVNLFKQEAFEKCWAHSLLRAVLHCHSPGVATAATVARRLRIDVHDDDDDNA